MPRTVGTASRFSGQYGPYAAFAQFGKSRAPSLPLFPLHRPQSAPQPLLKRLQTCNTHGVWQ
jgi:hypothetical protein